MVQKSSGIVRAGLSFCPPRGTRALRGRSDGLCQRGSVQGEEQRLVFKMPWPVPPTFQNTEDHDSLLVQRHPGLAASPGLSCPPHSKSLSSAFACLLGGGLCWGWGNPGNFLLHLMPLGSHTYLQVSGTVPATQKWQSRTPDVYLWGRWPIRCTVDSLSSWLYQVFRRDTTGPHWLMIREGLHHWTPLTV